MIASYSGYVAVDWQKVQDDAVAKIDTVSISCELAFMMCFFISCTIPKIESDFALARRMETVN